MDRITEYAGILKKERVEGQYLGELEERVSMYMYKNEIFLVFNPLDGFYGLFEEAATLKEYIYKTDFSGIRDVDFPTKYGKEKLIPYIEDALNKKELVKACNCLLNEYGLEDIEEIDEDYDGKWKLKTKIHDVEVQICNSELSGYFNVRAYEKSNDCIAMFNNQHNIAIVSLIENLIFGVSYKAGEFKGVI